MAKLLDVAGIIIYIVLNIVLFPLFILVYTFIGFLITIKALERIKFRIPSLDFRMREVLQVFYLKKYFKAISHSLHYLLLKR